MHDRSFVQSPMHVHVQLTVGTLDGRRLMITANDDGKDIAGVVGHILTSLGSIFPNVPTKYVTC